MSFNAHLLHDPRPEHLADLKARLDPGIALTTGNELPDPARFQVLIAGRPSRAQVEASPNLRAVIVPWAGIPPETRELLADFPHIELHNSHHNDAATAETAVALLLAAAKFVVPLDRALRRHDWSLRYDLPPLITLEGRTLLVLGYGAIGQRCARICRALGMHILALRRNPAAPAPPDIEVEVHPPAVLHALLPRADALLITLPLTAETRGLIGRDELALMPAGSLLVNMGRGPVVVEKALFEALQSGHLRAAGIDVWYNYPESKEDRVLTPPSTQPFHELDNVVMSPHRGGAAGSDETEQRRNAEIARLLNAAARGEAMPNRVDVELGY